jgi:hypothetical protein
MVLAYVANRNINQETRSALPNAPVIAPRPAGRTRRKVVRLRGWLASTLHRAAWTIKPERQTAAELRE